MLYTISEFQILFIKKKCPFLQLESYFHIFEPCLYLLLFHQYYLMKYNILPKTVSVSFKEFLKYSVSLKSSKIHPEKKQSSQTLFQIYQLYVQLNILQEYLHLNYIKNQRNYKTEEDVQFYVLPDNVMSLSTESHKHFQINLFGFSSQGFSRPTVPQ